MEPITLFMGIGFLLAAYSVIGNDSVQTLGTFMVSNRQFHWSWLWLAMSSVLIFTLYYGWYINGGDISYGRLNKIPFQEVQWYHALAPGVLLLLTRFGVPVSTSFLVLSAFATGVILEKMLLKSIVGYGLAAVVAYIIWIGIAKWINEREAVPTSHETKWRVAQWLATALLWYQWLSHDMANIAVFLPRQLTFEQVTIVAVIFVTGLAYIFWNKGGKIQNIVIEKHNTQYVRSATIIDLVYALILWYFKQYNDIPMSTTWVFVGLLCGREFAIATMSNGNYKFKNVFPLVGKDFMKMMIGLGASVGIVFFVHSMS